MRRLPDPPLPRFLMRRFCLALLFCLAACQPLPHPLADTATSPGSPALSPPDSVGIMVLPAAGAPAPAAAAVAAAMAKALREADVPASTTAHNQRSYRLLATAQEKPLGEGRSAVTLDWQLETASGRAVGRHADTVEAPSTVWQQGDPALAARLAAAAAPSIATLVEGDAPRPEPGSEPVVMVRGVDGAPGDGGRTLPQAIGNALARAHVPVIATPPGKTGFILSGRVQMSPPTAGKQHVKVSWLLARPDGSPVGRVDQQNDVPAGSLDGAWGDVAYAVATAAAPGIERLIEQATLAAAGG